MLALLYPYRKWTLAQTTQPQRFWLHRGCTARRPVHLPRSTTRRGPLFVLQVPQEAGLLRLREPRGSTRVLQHAVLVWLCLPRSPSSEAVAAVPQSAGQGQDQPQEGRSEEAQAASSDDSKAQGGCSALASTAGGRYFRHRVELRFYRPISVEEVGHTFYLKKTVISGKIKQFFNVGL